MVVDLHGIKIHEGWNIFKGAISDAYYQNRKSIKIITGKGQMLSEFRDWCRSEQFIREVELNSDGGSFTVKLKKRDAVKRL